MDPTVAAFTTTVVGGGLVIGTIFGFVASRSNFCTMGALSDVVTMGHWGRLRMWILAVAVAIVGTSILAATGQIDIAKSIARRPTLPWLSLLVGGLLFGVGMTFAGGCANKNLVRVGGGSVRSLVVLVFMGLSAYMTLKGLFAQWRASWLDPVAVTLAGDSGLGPIVARASGMDARTATLAVAAVVVVALLAFVFKDAAFRRHRVHVSGGVVLGLLIVAGWYVSGKLGYGENPETLEHVFFATNTRTIESMSFVAPVAFGIELLQLWTDKTLHITFGIASAIGIVLGSAAHALSARKFRWEGFASIDDLGKQLGGAVLMGFGGVTALGCTVGQGMSGLSTLAVGSVIAMVGIVVGCVATIKFVLLRD
jgi:hypothetical protein